MKTHHLRAVEALESRLAPANLTITNLEVVDASNVLDPHPVYGQMIYLRASWSSSAMAGTESCVVRYTVNGLSADSNSIAYPAGNGNWIFYLGGWYAGTTPVSATATVDPTNVIAESNENDNSMTIMVTPVAPSDLPNKFIQPLGRTPNVDWYIDNYADVNPAAGAYGDLLGGGYSYDGHDAIDAVAYNLNAGMDMGYPVYAAADGTVSQMVDGNFDRNTTLTNPNANYVRIDHGNNWQTLYYHLAKNSITVKVGDVVKAGQLIGLMGSSGSSTGGHLHFTPYYRGCEVEALASPSSYWISPLPYSGNVPATAFEIYTTNLDPSPAYYEQASRVSSFSVSQATPIYFPADVLNIHTPSISSNMTWKWYRPDGTLDTFSTLTPSQVSRYIQWYINRPMSQFSSYLGTWQFALEINGVEVKRVPFGITAAGTGDAAIRITNLQDNNNIIIDKRTTPLDFGSVAAGAAPVQQSYTITSHGAVPLTLGGWELPSGFSIVGSPPTSIDPFTQATLTLQLDTAVVGAKFGRVKIDTNDPESPQFTFNVSGIVTGSPSSGTPAINLPDKALGYNFNSLPRRFAPTATVTDTDSVNDNSGSLLVEVASGGDGTDILGVRNEGNAIGQIGVSGNTIKYGNATIGTFTGGSNATPLTISFTTNSATTAAVQALIRNLTYANSNTGPFYNRRYLRLTLIDNTGKVSNFAIANISPSGVERAPTIAAMAPVTTGVGVAFSRNGSFVDTFGNSWTATVNYGDGSGTQALTLNANKTFTIGHTYAAAGNYSVTVTISNDAGGITTSTLPVTVAAVNSIVVNGGAAQRSRLTTIAVNLSGQVDVAMFSGLGAITLTRTIASPAGVVGTLVQVGAAGAAGRINVTPASGLASTIMLTFDNSDGSAITDGVESGSLADGRWQLAIPGLNYQSPLNDPALLRLFGDADGDGSVAASDFVLFRQSFNAGNDVFDFDNDGAVSASDFIQFRQRFNVSI